MHMYTFMWFCICVSAFTFVCVRACTPITTQKPLCFPSVAFSAVAKTSPSPRWCSAAYGGAGVGLPGHVSGWWSCQSITQLHDKTHFACWRTGYESTMKATGPMWKSYRFKNEFDRQFFSIFSPFGDWTSNHWCSWFIHIDRFFHWDCNVVWQCLTHTVCKNKHFIAKPANN